MSKYIIITDSCVDLPQNLVNELNVEVLPLSVEIDGVVYKNHLDESEIGFKEFYDALRENKKTKTSQVNPESFKRVFRKHLEEGKDILSISFSSALSGTYNSSQIAAIELLEEFPDRKIYVIDSLSASMGQGLLVSYAANMQKEGYSIEEVVEWVEKNKLNLCHLFTVGDLNHLRRGGRLSYAKAFLGNLLKIKPLLHVSTEGKLVQTGATRGRKSSLMQMVDRIEETITNPTEQTIFISHGDCLGEVLELRDIIIERLKVNDVVINYVGPVIGSHSGLGTIAIFYLGNDRHMPYTKK